MNKINIKILFIAGFLNATSSLFSQNVGINTTGAIPSTNAILDLNTGNHYTVGLLIPHVTLGILTTFSPPIGNAATVKDTGLIVYNMNGVQPVGYYYWSGVTWVSVSGLTSSWLLTGNGGTSPGTNFLGTTDLEALEFKVDGQKAGWIDYTSPYNTFLGYETGNANTTGTLNTAVGLKALYSNAKQSGNIAIGDSSIYTQSFVGVSNSGNVAIGNSVLFVNQPTGTDASGNKNTAVGQWAMRYNTTGYYNTANGFAALYSNTTGAYNTAIGYNTLAANTTGSNNTVIGNNANTGSANLSNATALGNGATATASNQMVFGNNSITQHEFNGALMPYYGAAYNAGTLGQALISQGALLAPQWGAVSVPGGGTGSASFNPNALIFEGPTSTSPLTSSVNMTWNSNHATLILGTGTLQSYSGINQFGNINNYYQMLLQNTNSGNLASTDLVVNDDQDSTHYGDFGINSSTYKQAGYQIQSPGDVYMYSNKSNVDIGTADAAANGVDSIKFTCGGLNKSNLTEVQTPAGITTQVHFAADTLLLPIHTASYTPKYLGEKWIYENTGDTTECVCISLTTGRKVDSVTLGSGIVWTSTLTGFAATPTQPFKYFMQHKTCTIYVNVSANSNANTTTFTLPFIPKNSSVQIFGQYTNNSIAGFAGVISYIAGSNVAFCALNNGSFITWSNSGTKAINGLRMSYEIQ